MKIALISYEYPPDTAIGGIATYVGQAAAMLAQRGHYVEVFAASPDRSGCEEQPNLKVHRIQITERPDFAQAIAAVFADRHQVVQFDVMEGPDCGADAAVIAEQFPTLPLVLKLHTPTYILQQIGNSPLNWHQKIRFAGGALRRGKWPRLPQPNVYDHAQDPEYRHALRAQAIAAPSQAIGERVQADWDLDSSRIAAVPYPYIPAASLLEVPIATHTDRITFVGRLEIRKGILDLMTAIPLVLKQYPNAKFRFVGPAWPSPQPSLDMQQYICRKLDRYRDSLEFTGSVPLARIPTYLADTDICVFPSIWESFGLVCLEAMAAGRGVIGSNSGGMIELLDYGKAGQVICPKQPKVLAEAILKFLQNPSLRHTFGEIARSRVLQQYGLDAIGQMQEANYQAAIDRLAQTVAPVQSQ